MTDLANNVSAQPSADRALRLRQWFAVGLTLFLALLMFLGWVGGKRVGIGDFVLLGNPLARGQAVTTTEDILSFLEQTNASKRPYILGQQNRTLKDGRQLLLVKYRYGTSADKYNYPSLVLLTFDPKTNLFHEELRFEVTGKKLPSEWSKFAWYNDNAVVQIWGDDKLIYVDNHAIQVANWQTKKILVDKEITKETIELENGEEVLKEVVARLPVSGYYAAPYVLPLDQYRILISTSSSDTAKRVANGEPVVDVNEIFDSRTNKIKILEKSIGLPYNSREALTTKLSNGNYLLVWRSGIYIFNPRSLKLTTTHSPKNTKTILQNTSGEEAARSHIIQLDFHRVLLSQQNHKQPEIFIHDFLLKKTRKITYDVSAIKEGFFAQPPKVGGVAREAEPRFTERKNGYKYWLTPVTSTRVLVQSVYYNDLPWGFAIYNRGNPKPVYVKAQLPKTPADTYAGQFPTLTSGEPKYSMALGTGGALFIGDVWFAYDVPEVNLWDRFVLFWGYLGLAQVGLIIVSLLVLAYLLIRKPKVPPAKSLGAV